VSSPTQLTLAKLREDGYTAEVVERWVPMNFTGKGIRKDYLGAVDVLAISVNETLAIQCSAASGHAAHRTKCMSEKRLAIWLAGPARRFEIWSWETRRSDERTKAGKRSKRLVHHLRREEIKLSDFVPQQAFSEGGGGEDGPHAEQPREAMT
jgi:hypothetical protein